MLYDPVFTISGQTLNPKHFPVLGKGGTATVYDLGTKIPGKALKVLTPSWDYTTDDERKEAELRLRELRARLEALPRLPAGALAPEEVFVENGKVVGLLLSKIEGPSLSVLYDYHWRVKHHFSDDRVGRVFLSLGHTFRTLHARGIVVGDVKPDNVILEDGEPVLIDCEGLQFQGFPGRGFTPSCVDPLICMQTPSGLLSTNAPFSTETDWFGFGVMCFTALTFVGPYDGTYWKGKAGGVPLNEYERWRRGVSVYHPAVTVPPFARLSRLREELTDYFRKLFQHETREPFPLHLLDPGWSRIGMGTFIAVNGGLPSSAYL